MSLYFAFKNALKHEIKDNRYYPQFRLECRARDVNNEDSLLMRTADPLWMLGRQWQFGEFTGEDNGSSVNVEIQVYKQKIDHISMPSGGRNVKRSPLKDIPLEVQVEAMLIDVDAMDMRTSVDLARQLLRILQRRLNASSSQMTACEALFRLKYPFDAADYKDAESIRFAHYFAKKAFDGKAVLKDLLKGQPLDHNLNRYTGQNGELKAAVRLLNGARQEVVKTTKEFMARIRSLYFQPEDGASTAWNDQKLVYDFSVHSTGGPRASTPGLTLNAPDYQQGDLDWYSFDTVTFDNKSGLDNKIKAYAEQANRQIHQPQNLVFPSMPHKRLYAFEDRRVDLGNMEVDDTDFIRLMMVNFSMAAGNDWFVLPLEMELGELCWIKELRVKDTFGVITTIKNGMHNGREVGPSIVTDVDQSSEVSGLDVWDVFKIRDRRPAKYEARDHFLFLPFISRVKQESEALEELLFMRDEFANMAWAVENRVSNAFGNVRNGFDQHLEIGGPIIPVQESDSTGRELQAFRLAGQVPPNWIPFLPQLDGTLQRAIMVRNEAAGETEDILPLSSLARGDTFSFINQEAIPMSGVRVVLTNQRTRWLGGKTLLWRSRKVLAGRGEAFSNLRFDYLED